MVTVTIVQDYVPRYRTAFFCGLNTQLAEAGISLRVAGSRPSAIHQVRGDAGDLPFMEYLPRKDIGFGTRRLSYRNLRGILKESDLIVFEQARRNLEVYPLLVIKRSQSCKVALWGHGSDLSVERGILSQNALALITRRSDWFFAYTEASARSAERTGLSPSRITIVNNALDSESLRSSIRKDGRVSARKMALEFGLHDGPVVAYIGALTAGKRIDRLIEIFERAHRQDPRLQFLVAGEGPEVSRVVQAKANGLPVYPIGYAGEAEKAALSVLASGLLIPDQVGLVAIDSFAMGTPIVTSAKGRHGPEHAYLRDGENALLTASCTDTNGYVESILRLCRDERLRERLIATGAADARFL